jgi:hypothetical protein
MAVAEIAVRKRRAAAERANAAVLQSVAERLRDDPENVLPTLRLLADSQALPDREDETSVALARRLNAERLTERLAAFRAGSLVTSEVRALLGDVTRQAVSHRVTHDQLLALEIAGRLHFPDWQFSAEGTRPGLARIVTALQAGGRGALAADALMRGPIPEQGGRSAADLLAAGEVELAVHYLTTAGGDS